MTDLNTFEELIAHIENIASCERVFGSGSALIQFGTKFQSRLDSSTRLPRGKAKACYANATACALSRNDLYYAEGYGIDPRFPIPFEHAWLVDSSGSVLDPTWTNAEDHLYFGVAFKRDFLASMFKRSNGVCGLLSNWSLMRKHYGTPELLHAGLVPKSQFSPQTVNSPQLT